MAFDFINNLEPRLIIDFLYEQEVITLDELSTLNDTDLKQIDRRWQLLDSVAARGQKAFCIFKQAIENTPELSELSNELKIVDFTTFKQSLQSKPGVSRLTSTTKISRKRRRACENENRKSRDSEQYKRARKDTKQLVEATRVPRPVSSERKHIKHVEKTFDILADMYNNGQSNEFAIECIKLQAERPNCNDTLFTVAYMQVLFAQRKLDYVSEKTYLVVAKNLMPKTKDPLYSQLLVLSPQTRKYLLQKKFAKLQNIIDDRKMIVQSDPLHCTGRGAAWVYYNEGRSNALQLDMISDKSEGEAKAVDVMRERTLESYNRSLQHFNEEKGQDRIYGAAYVKFQLVVLLLRCGCNGLGMGRKTKVPKKDEKIADFIMKEYEESNSITCPILTMYFSIANCDRMFRKNLLKEALRNAETALILAKENMTEYIQPIQNRVDYLRRNTAQFTKPLILEADSSTDLPY
ncbi:uncharacterized protein LOC132552725 [Ylistrum balloti]|uniref:uncharacterized protein LOC132552725 n=1 Tax=Ylistrum balloti TaxID=509963 RepID=UPI002905CFD6|nr:uncharacterized protein LOC132552725 [Ylistrum balloti]